MVQCKRYAKHRTVGSPDLQKFNGTARSEHRADVPLLIASCKFTKQARAFAARHGLVLVDVDLLGFWNSGTSLTALLDLDISRSGTNRKRLQIAERPSSTSPTCFLGYGPARRA